ncbi:MAG: cell division topological specificity factor MinE [Anaerolineales bacterium]
MRSLAGLLHRRGSASTAKERLRLVLIHDRSTLPPGAMEALRDELIEVISRHVEVDRGAVRLEIAQEGRTQRLIAEIPLKKRNTPLSDDF